MALEVSISVAELKVLVQNLVQHTRSAPTNSAELLQGLNFGYGKALRAFASVRNETLQSFIDPFTLISSTTEYDLSPYDPPVWRPHKLLVDGSGGTTRTIMFRYRAITSAEFQDSEVSRAGTFNTLYYDILTGALPGTPAVTIAGSAGSSVNLTAGQGAQFLVGNLIAIPAAGPNQTLPGGAVVPTTYTGLVYAKAGDVLSVAPNPATPPGAGVTVTPLRRRVLKIVPAVNVNISGRLWYQYRPPKLVSDTDTIDFFLAEHRDMIVLYAASQLLQSVGDPQGRVFFDQAQELRSELMQDLEPLSGGASEALESDLWGTE